MASLSLREAAEQAGTSKSTIWRAIKNGKLSATRLDDGGFAIDPAELFRAFPPQQPANHAMGQDATPSEPAAERAAMAGGTDSLAVRLAAAEAELAGLKALMAEIRASRDDLRADRDDARADRDQWRERAERLLAAPSPARRPWWRRLAG